MRYPLFFEVTDARPGWQLGNRFAPRGLTITVQKYFRVRQDFTDPEVLSDEDHAAVQQGRYCGAQYTIAPGEVVGDPEWALGLLDWIMLDVTSSDTQPPQCVALRAPRGIGTAELRFPFASIVTTAVAAVASKDGSFRDFPHGLEYEDTVFEADRIRKRRRRRKPVTDERLQQVADLARANPTKPTAAVQHGLGVSRGYAIRLRKQAETAGL